MSSSNVITALGANQEGKSSPLCELCYTESICSRGKQTGLRKLQIWSKAKRGILRLHGYYLQLALLGQVCVQVRLELSLGSFSVRWGSPMQLHSSHAVRCLWGALAHAIFPVLPSCLLLGDPCSGASPSPSALAHCCVRSSTSQLCKAD